MNTRSRMIRKAIKQYRSSEERIQALVKLIVSRNLRLQMARLSPIICSTINKNYHAFNAVKIQINITNILSQLREAIDSCYTATMREW